MGAAAQPSCARFVAVPGRAFTGTTMGDRTVSIAGEHFTAADIEAGKVQISPARFIVGVKSDVYQPLLEEYKKVGGQPGMTMDALSMFCGTMDQAAILWLLNRSEVKYVEADGKVSICRPRAPAAAAVDEGS